MGKSDAKNQGKLPLFERPKNDFEKIANDAWERSSDRREAEAAEAAAKEAELVRGDQLVLAPIVAAVEEVETEPPHEPLDPEWEELEIPQHDFGALRPMELASCDVVRFDDEHAPILRSYSATGEKKGQGRPQVIGGLFADRAGVALLGGELPAEPIPLPPGTCLAAAEKYPYSAITHVAIACSVRDMMWMIKWASRPDTIGQYGGVPVIGMDTWELAEGLLEDVVWPKGVTFVVTKRRNAKAVQNAVFGARTVEVGDNG